MGIGRPAEKIPPESYVLETFSAVERKELPGLTDQACDAIEIILKQGVTAAMNRFNIRKSTTDT
jgi:PTH1 family peptidyl-tRNA hydrolase